MAISLVLDHFRAVKEWSVRHNVQAHLDMQNFQLTLERGELRYRLHPLFPAKFNGQFVHTELLTADVVGFGGWMPYLPYRSRWSTDKLLFKNALVTAGLRAPATWAPNVQPVSDYIVKRSQGSFGYDIAGPFRCARAVSTVGLPTPKGRGELFTEQFVEGQSAKIWYWGSAPFFVHLQDYPRVTGDGSTTVGELARARVSQDVGAEALASKEILAECLAFQGLDAEDVLERGRSAWIDFRYGRTFQDRRKAQDENALPQLKGACSDQLEAMGNFVARLLQETAPVALMTSVDAVLDADGKLWWLEMNTNSILPHHGYDVILGYLFEADQPSMQAGMPRVQRSG